MVLDKSIKISGKLKKKLNKEKIHPRETYEEVITNLIELKGGLNK